MLYHWNRRRKLTITMLFIKEEKILLNKRVPDLKSATCEKWLPLHTLAASGEFYFVDAAMKHGADVNAVDKDGWTAIHKAILGKKQAVMNYLLREDANPFVLQWNHYGKMDKRHNITKYRERLDRTLSSPKLTDAESLKSLVKNQILQSSGKETEGCSDAVIEKRTGEVSNFLDMLRSVSEVGTEGSKTHDTASHPEWKLKQDNEEFRVMYREGPQGSPFHSLLVEGYVNGPLDVCLCISWESALYRKWWPQSTIPTFKILSCNCLQKVRIGEQISLVRMDGHRYISLFKHEEQML
ncbi:hypothetical protein G4B88_017564 [Cannabis sativa]|uniref:Uncharacterized protein n=1 Tax=Cannabis sativa TaxID=3483 RepID=A0A7J6I3A9_CANSA|nr:hypothetical protein G4B88_017564 [Cannabis sativa]